MKKNYLNSSFVVTTWFEKGAYEEHFFDSLSEGMKFVWYEVYKTQPEMPKFYSHQHCCLEVAAENSQRYWELQTIEQWGERHEDLEDWEKDEMDYVESVNLSV